MSDAEEVAATALRVMQGFDAPWCVAGGWALDLFVGRVTRSHADLELAVFRQDQSRLHAQLAGWTFAARVDGRSEAWHRGEALEPPVHEIHAHAPADRPASIEFLLNERDALHWVFRRNPAIVLPLDRAIVESVGGAPVLCPEIVLLYKAKGPREKDEADFRCIGPALGRASRRWLRSALAACHPGHPWIARLDAFSSDAAAG